MIGIAIHTERFFFAHGRPIQRMTNMIDSENFGKLKLRIAAGF